jgi:hypothetical protein
MLLMIASRNQRRFVVGACCCRSSAKDAVPDGSGWIN